MQQLRAIEAGSRVLQPGRKLGYRFEIEEFGEAELWSRGICLDGEKLKEMRPRLLKAAPRLPESAPTKVLPDIGQLLPTLIREESHLLRVHASSRLDGDDHSGGIVESDHVCKVTPGGVGQHCIDLGSVGELSENPPLSLGRAVLLLVVPDQVTKLRQLLYEPSCRARDVVLGGADSNIEIREAIGITSLERTSDDEPADRGLVLAP